MFHRFKYNTLLIFFFLHLCKNCQIKMYFILYLKFEKMQHIISKIQKDGVAWLQESGLKMYRPSPTEFVHALHKVYKYTCIVFTMFKL